MPAFGAATARARWPALADAGAIDVDGTRLAMTTDSFVVKPLRFPGGSIGELAVNGTVNDLAVAGARPLALTVSMILEEGLDADVLARRGRGDRRRGRRRPGSRSSAATRRWSSAAPPTACTCAPPASAQSIRGRRLATDGDPPGDQVLVSGPIGEHGTAIMLARNEFDLDAEIESDTCSLWPAVDALLDAVGRRICTACATPPAAAWPRC